ncbi:MAG TPA: chemotaxis protein, partial [Lysobacter sp.]|nr:chemotaxis protein [Lysobacter sp.]
MTADALKVALLARPGVACDRLRGVLEQAGAQCVLLADPTELTLSQLVGAAPKVVLVALDPQTEDVLDRFDDVLLSDAGVEVIYEEASLAAAREGWDVARWQRHLVAKLQRHGDVLPPGTEPE